MAGPLKRLPASFYRTAGGNSPVLEWVRNFGSADRRAIGEAIAVAEFGWPVGMPVCRRLEGETGLWEIRVNISQRRIARLIFGIVEGRMVIVHGFVKKTRKTPDRDKQLARRRMKEVWSHE